MARPKHPFYYTTGYLPDGTPEVMTHWVPVKDAPGKVTLTVTAADVERSIAAHGAGNSRLCTMAMCAQRLAGAFAHPVTGVVDWLNSTAFVVSKRDRNGFPSECYRYVHDDKIAHLNDRPGRQHLLLDHVRQAGGVINVHLRPRPDRTGECRTGGSGRRDGSRSSPARPVGALLRYATANPGLIPPTVGRRS